VTPDDDNGISGAERDGDVTMVRGGEPSSPPRTIDGRYEVVRRLGGGGMAEVFLAEDTTLGRLVAVKVLRERFADDEEFVARFHREARAAAALSHPNVVAIHDRGGSAGSSYIVMEFVAGETLKERIQRCGRLSPGEARSIELGLLAALQTAHDHRVVHRDVTAQNILLDDDGRVKVADFGIAHIGASSLTSTGIVMGTSRYLSPEQARGEPTDERSDLYSAGVVLFEMLTGRLPFEGDNDLAIALQHAGEIPPQPASIVPDLPPALNAIVMKALQKAPAARYQSAADFSSALRAADLLAPWAAAPPAAGAAATVGTAGVASAAAADVPAVAAQATAVTRLAPASAPDAAAAPTTVLARPPRRRWLWPVLALVIVLATVVAAVLTYRAYTGRTVSVPAVLGVDAARAKAALRHAGFAVRSTGGYSDKYRAGSVMRQRPAAGKKAAKGITVALVVSKGPLHLQVVNVVGLAGPDADAALRSAGFTAERLRQHSRKASAGQVFKQSPEAGASVVRGSVVSYWVSTGPPRKLVPAVAGLSEGDATAALEAAGFSVEVHTTIGWGHMPGDVVKQDPAAGAKAPVGSAIGIWVAFL
jgi:serine/threonine-protein kinase